jgi:hypothetical protein
MGSLAALEASRARHRWANRFRQLSAVCYRAGVQAALDDGHPLPAPHIHRTWIDLGSDEPIVTDVALGEVVLALDGEELGSALMPDGQWDVEALIDQARDSALMQFLLQRAERAPA